MRVAEKLDWKGLKSGSLKLLEHSGSVKACIWIALPFLMLLQGV
jgi:hypothetical protein